MRINGKLNQKQKKGSREIKPCSKQERERDVPETERQGKREKIQSKRRPNHTERGGVAQSWGWKRKKTPMIILRSYRNV